MHESEQVSSELKNQANYWGVNSDRLYFLPRLKSNDYRRLLRFSDLFLDTRNYGSHTVASDSMFEGTPVLTLAAFSFASRVASSLNKADNIDIEMNCYNRKEYVNTGIKLFSNYYLNINKKKYNSIIDNINDKVLKSRHIDNTSSLFNTLLFAKSMEIITRSMYNVYLLYNNPFHIFLEESFNYYYLRNNK
jgi:predicted O-linked N-acetylglucosamine transferase (SPINDLY family)